MGYRCEVALTMLREDYDYLREIVESLDNEYERGAFIPHTEHNREVNGVKCVTLMWKYVKWHPEADGTWCALIKDFLRGAYDTGEEKPYQLIVMGEELDDIENEENGINYLGDDDSNLIPCSARVEIERRFVMND